MHKELGVFKATWAIAGENAIVIRDTLGRVVVVRAADNKTQSFLTGELPIREGARIWIRKGPRSWVAFNTSLWSEERLERPELSSGVVSNVRAFDERWLAAFYDGVPSVLDRSTGKWQKVPGLQLQSGRLSLSSNGIWGIGAGQSTVMFSSGSGDPCTQLILESPKIRFVVGYGQDAVYVALQELPAPAFRVIQAHFEDRKILLTEVGTLPLEHAEYYKFAHITGAFVVLRNDGSLITFPLRGAGGFETRSSQTLSPAIRATCGAWTSATTPTRAARTSSVWP